MVAYKKGIYLALYTFVVAAAPPRHAGAAMKVVNLSQLPEDPGLCDKGNGYIQLIPRDGKFLILVLLDQIKLT